MPNDIIVISIRIKKEGDILNFMLAYVAVITRVKPILL